MTESDADSPNHHLWLNRRTWWVAFTVILDGYRQERVRRSLGTRDLDHAAGLHREGFAALGERPWTRQELAELLASVGVHGLLIEACGHAVGFALCRVAADESELLTLAVSPAHRRPARRCVGSCPARTRHDSSR